MHIITLQQNVERVIENLNKLVLDSAMELKETIADLNVKQLEQGKRSDGEDIEPEYASLEYAKGKKAIGAIPPQGTPDLKVTGEFHSGFYAAKKSDEYIYTWSTDSKANKLNAKYAKIYGLTIDSIGILKPDLQHVIVKNLKDELQRG